MATLENDVINRVGNGAICIHNPNNPKWGNVIKNLKEKSVSIDMTETVDKSDIDRIKKFCAQNEDSKRLICLDGVFDGLSNNKEAIQKLLQERVLPNGEPLPSNAVLLCATDDNELSKTETNENVKENAAMLESALGSVVELSKEPTKEELNSFVDGFNTAMKTMEKNDEMISK